MKIDLVKVLSAVAIVATFATTGCGEKPAQPTPATEKVSPAATKPAEAPKPAVAPAPDAAK